VRQIQQLLPKKLIKLIGEFEMGRTRAAIDKGGI
jgi:hypothetical protein